MQFNNLLMVIEAINQRKSGFAFSEKSIESEKITAMFNHGVLSMQTTTNQRFN